MSPVTSLLLHQPLAPASPHTQDAHLATLDSSSSGEGFIPLGANLGGPGAQAAAPSADTAAGIPEELQQLCQELDSQLPLAGEAEPQPYARVMQRSDLSSAAQGGLVPPPLALPSQAGTTPRADLPLRCSLLHRRHSASGAGRLPGCAPPASVASYTQRRG